MAACTLTEFKNWSGVNLPDSRILIIIDDARRAVVRDGVSEDHAEFHYLHRLRTVTMLPAANREAFTSIRSKTIQGITTQFAGTYRLSGTPEGDYLDALMSVVGHGHRIL